MSLVEAEEVPLAKVVLLGEQDLQAAADRIARDTAPVDATTDHGDVEYFGPPMTETMISHSSASDPGRPRCASGAGPWLTPTESRAAS